MDIYLDIRINVSKSIHTDKPSQKKDVSISGIRYKELETL